MKIIYVYFMNFSPVSWPGAASNDDPEVVLQQQPKAKPKKSGPGYSVPKVTGVAVAAGLLAVLFALNLWRGPRAANAPLFLCALSLAVVVLVVTQAGRRALQKMAEGSLWVVNRAVCAADDAVCAVRSQNATVAVGLLSSCAACLYFLRWFLR